MRCLTTFDYDEFWKMYEANDRPEPEVPCTSLSGEELDVEAPAPAALRRFSPLDSFPPCRELIGWPLNFPVGECADLNPDEWAETDPSRFVYSDPELEGWQGIVRPLIDELEGPPRHLFGGRGERASPRFPSSCPSRTTTGSSHQACVSLV